jgi:alkylation response protein AidB-like acyl-CoA dehydrogenase
VRHREPARTEELKMQFVHSEEQQMIRASARTLLAQYGSERLRAAMREPGGYEVALWRQISGELGWSGLAIPEADGGAGLGWVELCILQEEQGRRLVASPFFASVALAGAIVREAANEAQRHALLERIAAGTRVACALSGPDGRPPPQAVAVQLDTRAGNRVLSGVSDFVIHADTAEWLLVLARSGGSAGLSVVVLPAAMPGISMTPHVMLDLTRPMAQVAFTNVPVAEEQLLGSAGAADAAVARGLDLARIALAAEALGGAEQVLEMTTEYVKQRVQFGRPIGSFQALKHRLADMMVQVEAAKSAAWYAACVADEGGEELAEAAAIAKSYCCDAFYDCAANAIQLHGGVGFTWEHDVQLYFKRARASATLLGSPAWHRERLMRVLGFGAAAAPVF